VYILWVTVIWCSDLGRLECCSGFSKHVKCVFGHNTDLQEIVKYFPHLTPSWLSA
jgi:hypothetical protein